MFNYFVPGRSKGELLAGQKLEFPAGMPHSLDDVLADCRRVPQEISLVDVKTGPDGKAGCVLGPVRKYHGPPELHYEPRYQDWADSGMGYWLGTRHGEAVSPQLLERWNVTGGAEVTDGQGHAWRVPIGRAPHHGHPFGTLPQSFGFDAAGEPQPRLLASHAWLWEAAGEIREWYLGEEGRDKQPFGWLVKMAARILAVNYRLGPAELNVLADRGSPVLTSDTVHAICQAAYGWEVREEAKKN